MASWDSGVQRQSISRRLISEKSMARCAMPAAKVELFACSMRTWMPGCSALKAAMVEARAR